MYHYLPVSSVSAFLLFILISVGTFAEPLKIITFDSGFGGFFTAKEIERKSSLLLQKYDVAIDIDHYGDTANAPYGEKTPERIAQLTSTGILHALRQGADQVFIACNTASTQYKAVQAAIEKEFPGRSDSVISIIDASAIKVKEVIDNKLKESNEAHFAFLATPATLKSLAYPKALAKLYQAKLEEGEYRPFQQARWYKEAGETIESGTRKSTLFLSDQKVIHIYQMAPGNWVDLIEKGANIKDKNQAVERDTQLLFDMIPDNTTLEGVGYFCTHYPVFDNQIQYQASKVKVSHENTVFISQGPLMAKLFNKWVVSQNYPLRTTPPAENEISKLEAKARANIILTGDNIEATQRLARTVFLNSIAPEVEKGTFTQTLDEEKIKVVPNGFDKETKEAIAK